MSDDTVGDALVVALGEWRRNAGALLIVLVAFGIARLLSSEVAYYGAVLVAFTVWMAWFVWTGAEFIRALDA